MILYSVQGRTGVNIEPATVARLARVENIVGIKEASGNVGQMAAILNSVPEDFIVLSGDDSLTLPVIALGGRGVISVASNEIPAEMAQMTKLAPHRRFCRGAADSPPLPSVDGNKFCGVESDSGESGAGGNGIAQAGVETAAGCAQGGKSGAHSRGAGICESH